MSALDTYMSLIKVDSRVAVSGLDDVNQSLERLIQTSDRLGLKSKDTGNALIDKVKGFKDVAASVLGFIQQHTEAMVEKVRTAQTLGIDIGQYDALSRAFQASGSDAKAFNDSIMALNTSLKEAAQHGDSDKTSAFKTLGVSPVNSAGQQKDADQTLMELSGATARMAKPEAIAALKQLGISDDATIAAIMKGSAALEQQIALQKAFGVMNEQDVETLNQFTRAQGELTGMLTRFSDELILGTAPALTMLINTTIELMAWGKEHQGFLLTFLGTLATAAIPALTVSLAGMAVTAAAAVAPFLPLIGAAILLGLAVDDLWNYFSGGNSVIGSVVQQFPLLGMALDAAKNTVAEAWEALKLLFSDPGAFMDLLVAEFQTGWNAIVAGVTEAAGQLGQAFLTAWEQMVADAKTIFNTLWEFVKGLFSHLGDSIAGVMQDAIDKAQDFIPDSVKKFIGLQPESDAQPESASGDAYSGLFGHNPLLAAGNTASTANTVMAGINAAPAMPSSPWLNSSIHNTQSLNVGRVELYTQSTDPQGIADSFTEGLKGAMSGLANHVDDGRGH